MKSLHNSRRACLVRVANRLAAAILNFVAAQGGKLGADGTGRALGRIGGGSACFV